MNLLYSSDVRKLIEQAIEQGFVLEHRSKGWWIIPPDKSKAIIALGATPSDVNVCHVIRRRLCKAGFEPQRR